MALEPSSVSAVPVPVPSAEAARQQVVHHGPPPPDVSGESAVLDFDLTNGLPTITGMIAGKRVKLGFDTGAVGGAHLTDRATSALGLERVGEAHMVDPSGRNPTMIPVFGLASLSIGEIDIRNWHATGAPAHQSLESLDGIIGLAPFRGFVVTIDYPRRQLRIARGTLPPADGETVFDYSGDPIPAVPLTVEGKTIRAHVDTGNLARLIAPQDFAAQLARYDEAKVMGRIKTVSNIIEVKGFPIFDAHVGDVQLDAADLVYPSITPTANIGSKALRGVIIRIDPANSRVSFERPPAPTA